jgi:hypothetical protein
MGLLQFNRGDPSSLLLVVVHAAHAGFKDGTRVLPHFNLRTAPFTIPAFYTARHCRLHFKPILLVPTGSFMRRLLGPSLPPEQQTVR